MNDDREEIYLELTDHLLQLRGRELKRISDKARVHVSTLYRWLEGDTIAPRIDTLCRVARALGFEFALVSYTPHTTMMRPPRNEAAVMRHSA